MSKEKAASSEKARIPFDLSHPVVEGDTPELAYRRPSGRDMRKAMNESGVARYNTLLENLFEETMDTFDRLDGRDYMRLIKLLDGFFDPSPATSAT